MSIRNKRLHKELLQLNNIILEDNWENNEIVNITKIHNNTTFNIKVNNSYPFSFPKSYIVIDNINIEYIEWFLNTRNKYIELINAFDIKVPCICCNTITCTWTPTMGVQNIINEIEIHYNKYYVLIQFNEIYNKINKFDNLIYKTIFDFLYFNNI
jgi:hypothetical protein